MLCAIYLTNSKEFVSVRSLRKIKCKRPIITSYPCKDTFILFVKFQNFIMVDFNNTEWIRIIFTTLSLNKIWMKKDSQVMLFVNITVIYKVSFLLSLLFFKYPSNSLISSKHAALHWCDCLKFQLWFLSSNHK